MKKILLLFVLFLGLTVTSFGHTTKILARDCDEYASNAMAYLEDVTGCVEADAYNDYYHGFKSACENY